MQRGHIVTVALQGDAGEPRPALVVQADLFDALTTVVVLPLTSSLQGTAIARVDIGPSEETGLRGPSQIVVHRPQTVRRGKVGSVIGRADDETMVAVSRALAVFLGLA